MFCHSGSDGLFIWRAFTLKGRMIFTNQTGTYNLSQWESSDRILMEDFNADNQKIEQALLEQAATIANSGNCKIVCGSYTGTGKFGDTLPNSLTFDSTPLVLFISGPTWNMYAVHGALTATTSHGSNTGIWIYTSWNGNTVSWYGSSSAANQMNQSSATYTYVALLAAE